MGRFRFTDDDDDSSSSDEEDIANTMTTTTTMPPRPRPAVGFHELPVRTPRQLQLSSQKQQQQRGRKPTPFRSSRLNFSMDDLSQTSSAAADNDNAEEERIII